jgi:hypothetical protein
MWLPPELAMQVGSYLNPHDLRVCTTQLCSSGPGFVAHRFTNDGTRFILHELAECCLLPAGVDDVAKECIERMESFLVRRGNVQTIILRAELWRVLDANASVYSDVNRCLQQGSSFQLSQNHGSTVQWHVFADSIADVAFLLEMNVAKDGAGVSDSSAGGALRQHLHKLDLGCNTAVRDVSPLASCQSLHTLDLSDTQVSDVSALASCQLLHTLDLSRTQVSDVSALASCQLLHTLDLSRTQVSDMSALASCQSLHTLDVRGTEVSDVSALASCQSLHRLNLRGTRVREVSALASCQSMHTLDLRGTKVSDVAALASCQSLRALNLFRTRVSDVSALASCQSLHRLDLRGTRVRDVSALASCQSLSKLLGVRGMVGGRYVLQIIQDRC